MREAEITEPTARYVIEIIVIGIVATLVTDIWQRLLQVIAGVPPAQWGLIGRWVAGFPRGVFVHQSIAAAKSVRGELALGWAFHYAIGIVWAALYVAIMKLGLNSGPTLIYAVAISLALLVAPWFVMQPALGMGFLASRTPKPAAARAMSVLTHTVFGDRSLPWGDRLDLVSRGGVLAFQNPSAMVPRQKTITAVTEKAPAANNQG